DGKYGRARRNRRVGRATPGAGGRGDAGLAARGLQQLVPARELDARPAVPGTALALDPVDQLPAGIHDHLDSALGEERVHRVGARARGLREPAAAGVLEQQLDRLGRVLLVRPDHAARPALDPAGAVDAGHGDALVVECPAAVVADRRPFGVE